MTDRTVRHVLVIIAVVLVTRASLALGQVSPGEVSALLGQAQGVAHTIPDESTRTYLRQLIGLARVRTFLMSGDPAAASREATGLTGHFRDEALMNIALVQASAGDGPAALATASVIRLAYSEEAGPYYVAWALARRGDVAEARRIAQSIRHGFMRANALSDIAVVQAEAGDLPGALATAELTPSEADHVEALADIALAQLRVGAAAGALATLQQAVPLARSQPEGPARNRAIMAVVEVYAHAADFRTALALTSLAAPSARDQLHWEIASAQAAAGDVVGARRTDVVSAERRGYLATALAEGGHLDLARESLARVSGDQNRIEALRHVAVVLAKRQQRDGAVRAFLEARTLASRLSDPLWRTCRLQKIAESQGKAGFVADALDTVTAIGAESRERAHALRAIAHARAGQGHLQEVLKWAGRRSDPLERASALLGAAEGVLNAAGFSRGSEIKLDRYGRRSNVVLDVVCSVLRDSRSR